MKVRITDLLDTYYDRFVRLDTPRKTAGQVQSQEPARRPMRGLVAVAAVLLVAATGAAVLGLRFQSAGGGALAEGEPAAQAEPTPEVTPEFTPEPTAEPTPVPEAETGYLSCSLQGCCQQGDSLYFSLSLDGVPAGASITLAATDSDSVSAMEGAAWEDVSGGVFGEGWEDLGVRAVACRVTLSGQEESLEFHAFTESGGVWYYSDTLTVPVTTPDRYVLSKDCIYEFGLEPLDQEAARVTRMEVTPEKTILLTVSLPESVDGAAISAEAEDWANTLVSITQSDLLEIQMNDGSSADLTLGNYSCELLEETDGKPQVLLTLELEQPLDPLSIASVTFQSQTIMPEDITGPVAAEDPDGDGLLTASVDLPLDSERWDGTLTRLTIDLSNGDFTWYYRESGLEERLYALSPEGDFEMALRDEDFNARHTELGNLLLAYYPGGARLVFTDGSAMTLYDGAEAGHIEGEFWSGYNLYWLALDEDFDLTGRSPAYLEIGGVRYDFQ